MTAPRPAGPETVRTAQRMLVLRLAGPGDATALAGLERRCTPSNRAAGGGDHWGERLALPHGDDHFVLVATLDDAPIAYALGGGSRDEDGKGDGELYVLGADPSLGDERATEAQAALIETALSRLAEAGYRRATCWLGPEMGPEAPVTRALTRHGFRRDRGGTEGGDGAPRRLGRPLTSSGCDRRPRGAGTA